MTSCLYSIICDDLLSFIQLSMLNSRLYLIISVDLLALFNYLCWPRSLFQYLCWPPDFIEFNYLCWNPFSFNISVDLGPYFIVSVDLLTINYLSWPPVFLQLSLHIDLFLSRCVVCRKELDGWEPSDDPWSVYLV